MLFHSFSRYVLVQVVAYLVDFGTFLLLIGAFGASALYANIAGKVAAGILAFAAHRHFTFAAARHGSGRAQLLRYALLLAANIPLSSLALVVFLLFVDSTPLAKFLADVVSVGVTFLLSRHFVFTASPRALND